MPGSTKRPFFELNDGMRKISIKRENILKRLQWQGRQGDRTEEKVENSGE